MGYIWFRLRLSPAKEASRAEFESQILQGETGVGLIMFRHDVGLPLNPFLAKIKSAYLSLTGKTRCDACILVQIQ